MIHRDGNPIISFLDDDNIIVWEILSRLPVKSLLRFKCVCKFWRDIIQNDPYFRDLHLTRSESRSGLLLVMENSKYPKMRFLSANLFERRAEIHTITDLRCIKRGTIQRIVGMPINGLICFEDYNASIRICNLGTRELTPWIQSKVKKELEDERKVNVGVKITFHVPIFEFGYDPATKEHKVICVWEICREGPLPPSRNTVFISEVLTVGQNSWRKIDEFPRHKLRNAVSICVNGAIYWRRCPPYRLFSKSDNPGNDVIVSFDLGSEKFREIQIPSFILNQIPHVDSKEISGKSVGLLEVDGSVALLHRLSTKIAKLWVFDDDTTTCSSINWIEETISLPFESSEVHFQPIAGTDQIIITCNKCDIYSYDRKRKTGKKVEISMIFPKHHPSYSLVTPFAESLLPVQHPASSSNDSAASVIKLKQLSL